MPSETETQHRPASKQRWDELAQAGSGDPTSPLDTALKNTNAQDEDKSHPSYYDISLLKPPVWTPEVGVYFFLGGLSAGAFILARLGERFGGDAYRPVTQAGTAIAIGAALPCAPLLILDLGDPKRFHHMLRVWKPHSPMNLGSWVLSSYTAVVAVTALREWLASQRADAPLEGAAKRADGTAAVAADIAGIPLALLLAGYTGVLLNTTATPVWSKNPWLGSLFSAGAVSAGSAAVRLALQVMDKAGPAEKSLAQVEGAARLAETVALGGYLSVAGKLASPLTKGPEAKRFWGGAVGAGLALPTILEGLPVPKKARRWLNIAASAMALVGGYALRAAFVGAGRPSANDPNAARDVSRPKK